MRGPLAALIGTGDKTHTAHFDRGQGWRKTYRPSSKVPSRFIFNPSALGSMVRRHRIWLILSKGAKQSLDVAIYDLKEKSVLEAFAHVKDAGKVKLRIRYDATTGSKVSGASRTVDPKPPTAAHVNDAGLGSVAEPISDRRGHLMHDKFIIRDGTRVWTGSGNFTNGGLHLQDNNYLTIEDQKAAAAYQK